MTATRALLIRGAALLPDGSHQSVLVVGERVAAIGNHAEADAPHDARIIDADGQSLAPGCIDLQLNGAFGRDFTEDPAAMWAVGVGLARYGVTSFLATIISAPPPAIERALEAWRAGPPADHRGARPIGLHLEGPFIAPAKRGAHRSECLRQPDLAEVAGWSAEVGVRMVTLAPELPGALELVRDLTARGVIAAAGHSEADAATASTAVDAGIRYGTHLFNAMPPLDQRAAGLAGALLADERVTVGLIADGLHVDTLMLALAWRAAGPGRVSVVSDASAALGQPDGRYRLGGSDVTLRDGAARLDDGRLAGSACPIDSGMRTLRAATGCSPAEAVATTAAIPARLLGMAESHGTIAVGRHADLVLLTPDLHVAATFARGEQVHAGEVPGWA